MIKNDNKGNVKILDVFSYLTKDEISIEQLKKILVGEINGCGNDTYEVKFNRQDIKLSNEQIQAIMELECQKKIAYVLYKNKVIAIIGYLKSS